MLPNCGAFPNKPFRFSSSKISQLDCSRSMSKVIYPVSMTASRLHSEAEASQTVFFCLKKVDWRFRSLPWDSYYVPGLGLFLLSIQFLLAHHVPNAGTVLSWSRTALTLARAKWSTNTGSIHITWSRSRRCWKSSVVFYRKFYVFKYAVRYVTIFVALKMKNYKILAKNRFFGEKNKNISEKDRNLAFMALNYISFRCGMSKTMKRGLATEHSY